MPRIVRQTVFSAILLTFWLGATLVFGQFEFEKPPISYSVMAVDDAISKLKSRLEQGQDSLDWNNDLGWLPSLLEKLEVPAESQTLVFSKTSLQLRYISPRNPRAVFFSDDVYIGYVPGGELIELSAVDDQQGAIFYSIRQDRSKAQVVRDEHQCMTCHGTSKTQGVPGYLVRSVFASASGQPHYGLGTITTSHKTEFKDRFGGWYLTGQHGTMRHRGNAIAKNNPSNPIDREKHANTERLPDNIDLTRYPADTSDIVALMVLEHQSQMHNLITRASYETRRALHDQKTMNKILERDADFLSDVTKRRIRSAGDKLIEYMFFDDEFVLQSPVSGSSVFAENFAKQGPFDKKGRSLREFDLQKRMFKYPCSFLIYSPSFDRLPPIMLDYVERRILKILKGAESESVALSKSDRQNILEILLETKPQLNGRLDKLEASSLLDQ